MNLEYQIIFGSALIIAVCIVLFYLFFSIRRSYRLKIDRLKEELINANQNRLELKKQIENVKLESHDTSYVTSQIKKIEHLEEELQNQRYRVADLALITKEANAIKGNVLQNINQQFAVPIESILLQTKTLAEKLNTTEHMEHVNLIGSAANRILYLVDRSIEHTKLTTGVFSLENTPFNVESLFQKLLEQFLPLAAQKGLQLSLEIDKQIPSMLFLDIQKLKTILENLLSNALKFTQKGAIKITVKLQKMDISHNSVDFVICVEDSGIGVIPENYEKIFNVFEIDQEGDIEVYGSGIGLSLNKKMATLMNGSLKIDEQMENGARFILALNDVEIVLISSEDEAEEKYIDFSLITPDGAKVLVVDADEKSHSVIHNAFAQTKIEVQSHKNSRDAIEALKEGSFDLVFIDLDMLSVDENAVLKVFAKISQAPIITLTNSGVRGVDFDDSDVKIVGHLKKPLSNGELFKLALQELHSS